MNHCRQPIKSRKLNTGRRAERQAANPPADNTEIAAIQKAGTIGIAWASRFPKGNKEQETSCGATPPSSERRRRKSDG